MKSMCNWIRHVWMIFFFHDFFLADGGQSPRPPRITEHPSDILVRKHEPATLNCKAEGQPEPSIEWYHEGNRVRNAANRMQLPSGALFFLHVLHTKREQDTGTYWCVATNELGKARSRNATLEVAVIREDFRVVPKSVSAAVGESATLECTPPKGHPEPTVRWRKDGDVVNAGKGRIRIVPPGNLVISEVRQSDEGRYACVAENMAGIRESGSVHMAVHVKPFFVKEPEHLTVLANADVSFPCKVGGDPPPSVSWRRKDGKMPVGRSQISNERSLIIKNVDILDEGTYVCEAENSVGMISSEVTLTVHSRPNFLVKPKDQRIGLNGIAKMECSASGNPPPSIFWTKEGNQVLMFPQRSYGRFSVNREGTLIISGVRKEDDGYYICSVLSGIGSSMAKAYLEVTAIGDLPAPVIKLGPANQTLPLNTKARLPCEASGNPAPVIRWLVNSTPLAQNSRFRILDSGTLEIDSLQPEDTGVYTCTASSESGETSWSATLTVESPRNPNVIFHRMPDPVNFPGPPSKPVASNVSETSVTLSWKKNAKPGASPLIGYTVEYYSSDLQSGWVVVAHRVPKESYTINNLRPDTKYAFLIRAENSHGLGLPSEISDIVHTLGFSSGILPNYDLDEARNRLNDAVTFLQDVIPMSSTSVKMLWKVQGASGYIEGFYMRFRDLSGGSQKYNIITVLNGGSSSYVLSDLKKFTKYEFFLVPFYKGIEGPPSNSKIAQTLEDVPSAPPGSLKLWVNGHNSASLSWSPPPPQHRNGLLQGYSVRILDSSLHLHSHLTTNATTTSITLTNLTYGSVYDITVAALTSSGMGPFSPSIHPKIEYGAVTSVGEKPTSVVSEIGDIVRQPWFIAVIGVIIFILLSIFFIVLFFKRRKAWKKGLQAHLSGPVHKADDVRVGVSARETLWINQAWHPVPPGKNCLPDDKLLNNVMPGVDHSYISLFPPFLSSGGTSDYAEVDTHNMTSFYKKELPAVPAPYATTTLINPSARHHSGSVHDGKSSGSEVSKKSDKMYDMEARLIEDCVTEQLLEARNVMSPSSDSGSYTTDEYGLPIRRKRLRSGQKGSVLNWMEFIPPPPDHPPSERGSPTHLPPNLRNPYPVRNIHSQIPLDNSSNLSHSPQVSRSLQSTALARHTPTTLWSHSLTRAQEDANRAPTPPPSMGTRYPIINNHVPLPQSYGSSPGVDRGIQSSLLSLASDPCPGSAPGMKKGSQERCAKINSLQKNPGVLYHELHPEPLAQEKVRYDNVMQNIKTEQHSPVSSIPDDVDYAPGHCAAPSWTSVTDRSSNSSARSSVASSSEGSVYTDSDFANVVARAAQNAGFHLFRPMSSPNQPSNLEMAHTSSLLSPVHNC